MYNKALKISYDPAKNRRNIAERELSFDRASEFDFDNAVIAVDDRKDYQEVRYVALGNLAGRVHVLCFTLIDGGVRVISFRKANKREVAQYETQKTTY
ncbi:BrnT family toxin [Allohahella marinimesophila]|uniref:BrnT family toxin n=1 Tax=Allohahella marinimesophila TaxID=1054972 RepID=A0ABP7NSS2_9GAMM